MRLLRYFKSGPTAVMLALLLAGTLTCVYGILRAQARLAVDAERAARCRVEVALIRARNPFVATYLCPADACLCRQVIAATAPDTESAHAR